MLRQITTLVKYTKFSTLRRLRKNGLLRIGMVGHVVTPGRTGAPRLHKWAMAASPPETSSFSFAKETVPPLVKDYVSLFCERASIFPIPASHLLFGTELQVESDCIFLWVLRSLTHRENYFFFWLICIKKCKQYVWEWIPRMLEQIGKI